MSDMKPLDLEQQVITLGGIRMEGYGDGDAATIEYDGPAYTDKTGADGETVRSRNYNRTATVTVRLMQTSAVNDLLSAVHAGDMKAANGAGVLPFLLKDVYGTTLLTGGKAWISAPPNVTVGAEAQVREWKIRVAKLDGVWGSN